MNTRVVVGVLLAVSVAAVIGVVSLAPGGPAQEFTVSEHPTDDSLQREDTVVVSDGLAEFERELRLLTHRVDALRGGDDVRHRIRFRLGSQETAIIRDTSLVRLQGWELDTIGIEGEPGTEPDSTAFAVSRLSPGSRNVTVVLPEPGSIPRQADTSYSFIIVHELAGIPLDEPTARDGEEQRLTTDYVLARRGVSEGTASHIGAEYVERYDGAFDPSFFRPDRDDHPHDRIVQWAYYEGYEFAERQNVTATADAPGVQSTRALLTPSVDDHVHGLPEASFAERLDGVDSPTYTDRPGPLVVRTTLTSRGVGFDRADGTVAGWRNGRIDRYLADGTIVSVWTTVWRNETAAAAFARAYGDNVPVTRTDSFSSSECQSAERLLSVERTRVFVVRCS